VTAREARAAALKAARERDSQNKRRRVLEVLDSLQRTGMKITFARVAKEAGVSSWLTYSPGLREPIEAARRRQEELGIEATAGAVPPQSRVSNASLKTDLALAQQQIKELREERNRLRERLRLQLGTELNHTDTSELTARVEELNRANAALTKSLQRVQTDNKALRATIENLEDDLTAARQSLRKMMRAT
jgi:DNA repair exonuclease SbcCD ATPase subunit